jgi:pilus assembly protein CpaE
VTPAGPTARGALVVVGATGGCGTSLLAGALALAWQRAHGATWLVELDLGRGDLADAWDLPGDRTIDDLAEVSDELAPHHLRAAAQPHPSGLAVLVAPPRPAAGWDAPAAARLVATAGSGDGDRCVVDAGCGLRSHAIGAAASARGVLVACAPRIAAARRARHVVEGLARSAPSARVGIVVCGGPGRSEIGARALGRAVGAPVTGELPWSPREADALSAGRWPARRRRGLAAAVAALAEAT